MSSLTSTQRDTDQPDSSTVTSAVTESADLRHVQNREDCLSQDMILPLLHRLPALGDITCVILHGGCVFEFSGPFPAGTVASGFYNLQGSKPGFHGHLSLEAMARVRFQDRPHRGRASYALVFEDAAARCLFKVFLGRDENGDVIDSQLAFFHNLRATHQLPEPEAQS